MLVFALEDIGAFLISGVRKLAIEGGEQNHWKAEVPEGSLPAGCLHSADKPGSLRTYMYAPLRRKRGLKIQSVVVEKN